VSRNSDTRESLEEPTARTAARQDRVAERLTLERFVDGKTKGGALANDETSMF